MSEVFRVCPSCQENVSVEARHCAACGYDTQGGYALERRNLPAAIGRAALPVAAGLASVAIRAGWRALRRKLPALAANAALQQPIQQTPTKPQVASEEVASTRPRQVIRIRSKWAVGDHKGVWHTGEEEHIIEIDE